ncbi:DUF4192 domain-containing protein [Luethyella okanaganae]|uniref:DUF4192 domain-containing protein n=1 Tax=Luethyella okanaganae TaxID=69372 RepID=A0ABW1VL21_9MICO
MQTIIKAEQASDFLALVPHLAGFRPRNSIVLVAFRGKRTCGAMRFDLPEPNSTKVLKRIATTLIGMLCKIPGVDAVVPVAYTDERFGSDVIPYADFVDLLIWRAEQSGFLVRDALCVAADGWGSYLDPVCPRGGHPLDDIAASPVNDAIPSGRRRGAEDQTGTIAWPIADSAMRQRVGRALKRYQQIVDDPDALAMLSDELPEVIGIPALAEAALAWDPPSITADDAARLLFCLQRPPLRDAVLLQWAFGLAVGERALADNIRFIGGDESAAAEAGSLLWGEGPRPDPGRIEDAHVLLLELVVRAPKSARLAPLCMLAWLNWALGRSSRAGVFIDQAFAIEPGYGLAGVLHAMVHGGRLPEWAFDVPFFDEKAGS